MSWEHRVFRKVEDATLDWENEVFYFIGEVYYDDNDAIDNWTVDEVAPYGNSFEELRESINRMMEATNKPVLDYKTGKEVPRDIVNCFVCNHRWGSNPMEGGEELPELFKCKEHRDWRWCPVCEGWRLEIHECKPKPTLQELFDKMNLKEE